MGLFIFYKSCYNGYILNKKGAGHLATLSDINVLYRNLQTCVDQLNNAGSFDEFQMIALNHVGNLVPQADWGNGSDLVSAIVSTLQILGQTNNANINAVIDEFNDSVIDYTDYLNFSWWQFGGGDDKRSAIATVPSVSDLVEFYDEMA